MLDQYHRIAFPLFRAGVIDVLNHGPLEQNAIGKRLGVRYDHLAALLSEMENSGHVFHVEDWWSLTPEPGRAN